MCKFSEEAQAMHFGASKVQLSLHTGVQYTCGAKESSPKSFATVSSCLDHGAHAIWAHLQPVLQDINAKNPEIDTMHIVSDGPTAQYRNRFNLWYMSHVLPKMCPNIKNVT